MGNYSKCHIGKTFNNTNIVVVDGEIKLVMSRLNA